MTAEISLFRHLKGLLTRSLCETSEYVFQVNNLRIVQFNLCVSPRRVKHDLSRCCLQLITFDRDKQTL